MPLAYADLEGSSTSRCTTRPLIVGALSAFALGLVIGSLVAVLYLVPQARAGATGDVQESQIGRVLVNHSYSTLEDQQPRSEEYRTVTFVDREEAEGPQIVTKGIYWGDSVEHSLPQGYHVRQHDQWADYVQNRAVAVKLEPGCGRMQNRLVVFEDGTKGCVRYRQNTDQIQGELFSFYLAQVLKLPNLAPSAVSVVDLEKPLWRHLVEQHSSRNDISSAQWHSNKPVVLTQFIDNLGPAEIPGILRPIDRHLNKFDLNATEDMRTLVELAQWSDLIIFDYLTANLDRVVNNLYNYQWNVNIMEAPAHNLAKAADGDLLVFLDNESGLLHGYRLLKKYEVYHSLLLDNLCVFRRSTAEVIKRLRSAGNVGGVLREMFERQNSETVRDLLPTLPEKSVKILNERIDRVYGQISKCESIYSH